jgi:hypothetical protein
MKITDNPIFDRKESILTLALISFEAISVCILEGMVIMFHLQLVSNCTLDDMMEGIIADRNQ